MIRFHDTTKRFRATLAVDRLTVTIAPGEVVAVLGPNGSGKTTTVRMLTGLTEPSDGTVVHDGRNIYGDLVAFRRRLGYVPEEAHLYPFLSGREYLELVGRLRELPVTLLEKKIMSLLDLFGILSAADQPISGYSKGMKQKILISAALLHDPDLLILDEPESGLDVTAVLVLRSLITELARRGKAILYSSHIMESVERVCSRVMVLHRGAVVADDSSANLRTLLSRDSLEAVFAELVVQDNPARTASDIADVAAMRA